MATAKKTSAPVVKKAVKAAPAKSTKAPVKAAAKAVKAPAAAPAALKPIKTAFNKSSLATHVAEHSGIDLKAVKSVLASLEAAMLASVHKKGLGEFTLPGLLKVVVHNVPAKKKRMGKDPFTGVERMFAAKPASVKIKTRALKKLKDAAL
jgi:hypothetical protein